MHSIERCLRLKLAPKNPDDFEILVSEAITFSNYFPHIFLHNVIVMFYTELLGLHSFIAVTRPFTRQTGKSPF